MARPWRRARSTKYFSTTHRRFLARERFPSLPVKDCAGGHSACGVSSYPASAKTSRWKVISATRIRDRRECDYEEMSYTVKGRASRPALLKMHWQSEVQKL